MKSLLMGKRLAYLGNLATFAQRMEAQHINKAVKDLLDKLVGDLPGYRWDSACAYSDGRSMTMIELNIWRKDGQEAAGGVAYQLETGDVLHFRYPPMGKEGPEQIVDFLLDLYNLERKLSEAALRL